MFTIGVTAAAGIEGVTKRELTALGFKDVPCYDGRFDFDGSIYDVAKCNALLRTAERVFLKLFSGKVETFDELFDLVRAYDWRSILPHNAKIVVNAKSVRSKLFALSACQSIAKKAIISRMLEKGGNVLEENGARYGILISITDDICTVLLDTSGDGLHKRGYRKLVGEAPIRETTACAMLILSNWNAERPLIDPFCGSGTIPIEAARMALNIPTGEEREFDFQHWNNLDGGIARNTIIAQAKEEIIRDKKLRLTGYDIDKKAKNLADVHSKMANVSDYIHFQCADMRTLSSRYEGGFIVTNPPYGERLMSEKEVALLYRDFRTVYDKLDNWSLHLITSCESFEKYFGKRADKTRKLNNAQLKCRMYCYYSKRK